MYAKGQNVLRDDDKVTAMNIAMFLDYKTHMLGAEQRRILIFKKRPHAHKTRHLTPDKIRSRFLV